MAEVDLSQFDEITDRVVRAKAKAEAVRKARENGGRKAENAPQEMPDTALSAGEEAAKAVSAGAEPEQPGFTILNFSPGLHFKWGGRSGNVLGTRYDLVSLVYDDAPDHVVTIDRYRLSYAHAEGKFEFAPKPEDYRPERTEKGHRVDYHDYVWLDTRKGMVGKKKRPRSIAIINPDYCTGCNACIEVCPTDCIEEVDVADAGLDGLGHFCEIRLEDCIGCKQCVTMCPWKAIDMVDTQQVEEAYGIPAGTL